MTIRILTPEEIAADREARRRWVLEFEESRARQESSFAATVTLHRNVSLRPSGMLFWRIAHALIRIAASFASMAVRRRIDPRRWHENRTHCYGVKP